MLSRLAYALPAPVQQRITDLWSVIVHNLHGFVAVPGAILHLVCVYDDPADLAWAQRVWRSVRPEKG